METNQIIETQFHCDISWHLKGLALQIYILASKLAHESGKFFPAIANLAQFYDVGESTVSRALGQLEKNGFLNVEECELFKPTVYRVVSHSDWASKHPGKCCQKETLPWTGDPLVDPLAPKFHSVSGGRIKFRENDMKGLRKLNRPDEELVAEFSDFFEEKWEYCSQNKQALFTFSGKFVKRMKEKCAQKYEPLEQSALKGRAKILAGRDKLARELHKISGVFFFGKHYSGLSQLREKFSDGEIIQAWQLLIKSEAGGDSQFLPMKFIEGGCRSLVLYIRKEAEEAKQQMERIEKDLAMAAEADSGPSEEPREASYAD
jgi:hypothetical protein